MRNVVLYIAVSLDGYIADTSGRVDWLGGDGSNPEHPGSYPEFIQTVDDVILGYKTFHQIATELDPDHWPYEGQHSYVLTHRAHSECARTDSNAITFVCGELAPLIARLKASDGKRIWLCGGASIVTQAMKDGLIDEYVIDIMPTILGSGIRLFEPTALQQNLRLVSANTFNGIVNLWYEIKR